MNKIYNLLEWDTRFFGYKVASIRSMNLGSTEFNETVAELKNQNVKLIYCFADHEDEISNDSFGKIAGSPVDKKVTFFIKISEENDFERDPYILSYRLPHASEKLKSLALQSGLYSRFKTDLNFQNNEYEKLYLEWIEKSVEKVIAEEILVYSENNDEKGLITLGLKGNEGSIGLLAVDEKERGKSIGRKLVLAGFSYFKDKKVNIAEVVTQLDNKGACRFYESLGFQVKNIVNIYHLWIS